MKIKTVLVIAPHPDDEVLGCGGTIANLTKNGAAVFLCIVTQAYSPDWSGSFLEKRPHEVAAANKILGIKKTFFLNLPTVKLDTIPQKELNHAIDNVIGQIKPEELYIPHPGDLNKDHRLVAEATLVACRPGKQNIRRILSYETLSETEWGQEIEPFIPNVYVNITDTFRFKLNAMKAYKSELKPFPHPRSLKTIKALAQKRGSESGVKLAEAFKLIRELTR